MRVGLILISVLLVASNVWWAWLVLNSAVSDDHARMELAHTQEQVRLLQTLALDLRGGRDRRSIETLVRTRYSAHLVPKQANAGALVAHEKKAKVMFSMRAASPFARSA